MKASEKNAPPYTKILYIGNSGTGKTGSLISLIEAGYNLRILDMDNGLTALLYHAKQKNPAFLEKIDSISLRDSMVADPINGLRIKGSPKAYTQAIKYLNTWDDGSNPAEWGDDTVFVLDSLTAFGRAAFNWAVGLNSTAKDGRQWYFTAQESIKKVLELLTAEEFKTNVIVCSHIQSVTDDDGKLLYEQTAAVGKALGPDIPILFDIMIGASKRGAGDNVKRVIRTTPTPTLDLKFPAKLDKELPLKTGLATVFKTLKATT